MIGWLSRKDRVGKGFHPDRPFRIARYRQAFHCWRHPGQIDPAVVPRMDGELLKAGSMLDDVALAAQALRHVDPVHH